MEISKEFINQLLELVNSNSNSKIRSKQGYGIFKIEEYFDNKQQSQVCMELWYKPTKIYEGFDKLLLRKCYDLTVDHLEVFQSVFYYEVVKVLTSNPEVPKLINYGIDVL